MATPPWTEVLSFDLDNPISLYGFSTRLASENYWTKDFTEKAIVEYKKFMYLAAISDVMVSPSEIVDVVWHQHLIFTQSYADFCAVLGKTIQHVPSTHNKEDFQKFKLAKERTNKLYTQTFGKQPVEIWDYADMFEPLGLEKAKYKIRTATNTGTLIALLSILPLFFLLRPIYVHINNPLFLVGYVFLAGILFIGLREYNRSALMTVARGWKNESFIHNLKPDELIYAKTKKLDTVIHGHVDQLIKKNKIVIDSAKAVKATPDFLPLGIEEYTIFETLATVAPRPGAIKYSTLLAQLLSKPAFHNVSNCMEAFEKYFNKSKFFFEVFRLNFIFLSTLFVLGMVRLFTGIVREKPVGLLLATLVILVAAIVYFLWRLTKHISTHTITTVYEEKLKTNSVVKHAWGWDYYTKEAAFLDLYFVEVAYSTTDQSNDGWSSSSDSSSSCGSSCGSSCSSCGGCGGD